MKKFYLLILFIVLSVDLNAQNPFITTWQVSDESLDITIPAVLDGYTYNYTVDFGDGTILTNVNGSVSHTYSSAGMYTVEITGEFPAIRINNLDSDDKYKLMSIEQWGDISWQTMYRAFNDAYNLVVNATDAPDLSQVTDMSYMFINTWNFNQSINHWDVSNVENMSWMFDGAESFNQPLDNWDVSSVTNMYRMFFEAFSFNQPLNNWNVSNVTSMGSMFSQEANPSPDDIGMIFNQPLDNWNVANVTSMDRMFYRNEFFNQPLNSWDVSSVSDMDYMFSGCVAFNQPLNNWNTSNVFSMDRMFQGATNFNQNINSWDVSNVEDMSYFFAQAESFNEPLDLWDVSSVTNMYGMFNEATSFNQPLNSWNVSNVTLMTDMFEYAANFNQPLDNWDVSAVESMSRMFKNATSFNSSINGWVLTGIVQNSFGNGISAMFYEADSFNQPLDNWDISNLNNLAYLFNGATAFNQNIDNWDVSNVTDVRALFKEATSFNQPLNSWDVSNITDMADLFWDAVNFNQPLNNWDTGMASTMAHVFRGASSFNQPLDNWNVSQAGTMNSMFKDATSFNQNINNWNVSNVQFFTNLFSGASSFNQPLDNWNFSQMSTGGYFAGLYDFLSNTNMSIENYDALLQHLTTFNIDNVDFGADGLRYCDEVSVDYLENQLNWNIDGHFLGLCNNVSGTVYFDSNINGCDASDHGVSNYLVFFINTENQNIYAKQITNGSYSGGVGGTNFTASVQGLPDYLSASPVNAAVEFIGDSTDETLDFCITPTEIVEDLSVTLIPISEARPGFECSYQLIVENIGSDVISNINLNLTFNDASQSFVSAVPVPTATNSNTLGFTFSQIDPFQSQVVDVTLLTFPPPTVLGDDILSFEAMVLPDTNDYSPENNTYLLDQTVVNSFDPNDITVLQGETITTEETDDYLDYIIRFQNTGTASAINVEIESFIDPNVDASTIRILNSSHNYTAEIENFLIRFSFDNINLPDESSDPEGSNGFIAYRVKPKLNIQVGDEMDGIAGIYFDFNEPIITNMVTTEVINSLSVTDYNLTESISIYPNPADSGLYIKNTTGVSVESVQLYDMKGSKLLDIDGKVEFIDSSNFKSGVYTLVIDTTSGKLVRKLILY